MADVSYESLQSQISEQKGKITTQKEFIKQERIVGQRSIESLRRVHPRTPPSVWFGERKPRMESIRGRLVELKTAEKELDIAETKLSEQEALFVKRKAEGYEVRETTEGQIEFYKPAPESPYGHVVRRETHEGKTIAIHYSSGVIVYPEAHMIDIPGQPFQKLPSHPLAKPFVKPEPHIVIQRGLEPWYEWKQREKERIKQEAVAKEQEVTFLTETIPKKHPSTHYLLTQAEDKQITQLRSALLYGDERAIQTASTAAYESLDPQEKIQFTKSYAIFGEDKKTWGELKKEQPDVALKVKKGEVVVVTPETDVGTLFEAMGKEYKKSPGVFGFIRAGVVAGLSVFRPETWIAGFRGGGPLTGGMLGVQPRIGYGAAVETLRWEYPITKIEKPVEKFVAVARPAYETVVIPFIAGAGLGVAFRGIGLAAKAATGVTAKVLTKFAAKVPYVYGGVISAMVGADIGYTTALEERGLVRPGTTIAKISRYGVQFAFAVAGARWVAAPRPPVLKKEILYRYGEAGEPVAVAQRKYVDFLGKPRYYGKPVVGVKPETLFVKTFDPYLAYARVSKYGVVGVTPTVVGEPPTPYGIVVRPPGALVPTRIPAVSIVGPPGIKPLWRIDIQRDLRYERELARKGEEISIKQYEEVMRRASEKLRVPFKPPKPRVDVLKVKKIDVELGYAVVEKYGVIGVTPTVVGKPPIPVALIIRPTAALVPTEFPIRVYKLAPEVKPLWRIPLEPKTRIELEAERELRRLWDEKQQRQYEETMKRAGEKLGITFKPPKPRVDVLKVKKIDVELGYAVVEKYGVIGVTPTVVGKPPVPGIGIYTGRQLILRPISALTVWDWLIRQPIRPPIEKEPLFRIYPILMKPIKYTLKDIIKEPKIEPGVTITRDGQILIQKIIKETKPPIVKKKLFRPERVYDPYEVYEETEFVRNEMVESFNRLIGKPTVKPVGPAVIQRDILLMFPTLKAEPMVKERVTPITVADIDRDIRQIRLRFLVTKLDRGLLFDTLQTQYQTQIQFQMQMQKPMQKLTTATIQEQIQFQAQILDVKPMQKLTTATIQEQIQFQAQILDVKPMQKFIQEQITITERKPKPLVFVLPDTPYKMFGHTMGQGYNVKIKERHIVKGKKIKEPRFLRINKRPLSLRDAEALRGMVLDNSAAASGKIVPVNAMAQEPLIDLKPFEDISHKFYLKDDILIEKRKYRIDTKGEKQQISALGWYAERTAKAAKKREVVARRPRVRVVKERAVRERDMFDMGMPDMLIDMNKIFKGVMGFGF